MVVAAPLNGARQPRFPKPGKTGNKPHLENPALRAARRGRALTVLPARTAALELLPLSAVHSATPQGTTKTV
jgi:hypothetical protein